MSTSRVILILVTIVLVHGTKLRPVDLGYFDDGKLFCRDYDVFEETEFLCQQRKIDLDSAFSPINQTRHDYELHFNMKTKFEPSSFCRYIEFVQYEIISDDFMTGLYPRFFWLFSSSARNVTILLDYIYEAELFTAELDLKNNSNFTVSIFPERHYQFSTIDIVKGSFTSVLTGKSYDKMSQISKLLVRKISREKDHFSTNPPKPFQPNQSSRIAELNNDSMVVVV